MSTSKNEKRVSLLLGVGILFFPYLFSWFTLKDGYSTKARLVSISWCILLLWSFSGKPSSHSSPGKTPTQDMAVTAPVKPSQKVINPSVLKGLSKDIDKMEALTWYYHPIYGNNISGPSHIAVYMGSKSDHQWLRLMITYTADDWLFVDRYKLLVDGSRFELTGRVETKVGDSGKIHEWLDVQVDETHEAIIRSIANSKEAIIRYQGRQFYKDRKITKGEKEALRRMIAAFDSGK